MEPSTAVKLERLLIGEVSGVDDPASELPGWMVTKAAPGFPIGPDQTWDVGAAEGRIRTKTGAGDGPNAAYAKTFLYKGGDGTKFGDYKFLVCDVVGGAIKVMPAALRAAASRLPGSNLTAAEQASVRSALDTLEAKAGIGAANKDREDATSLLEKVKRLILGSEPSTAPEGDIDMTSEELTAALDERLAPIVSAVEAVSKSVEASLEAKPEIEVTAPVDPDPKPADESAVPALTIEDIAKAIETALEPYNEILEKVLDRIEGTEKALAVGSRRSLTGQEGGTDETATPSTPDLNDAIIKALRNPSSVRVVEVAS